MEMIENYMVMPQPEYNTNWQEYYDAMAEKADIEYDDRRIEEMMRKKEQKAANTEKAA